MKSLMKISILTVVLFAYGNLTAEPGSYAQNNQANNILCSSVTGDTIAWTTIKLGWYSGLETMRLRPTLNVLRGAEKADVYQADIREYMNLEHQIKEYMKAAEAGYAFNDALLRDWADALNELGLYRRYLWGQIGIQYEKDLSKTEQDLAKAIRELEALNQSAAKIAQAIKDRDIANDLVELTQTIASITTWASLGKQAAAGNAQGVFTTYVTSKIGGGYDGVINSVINRLGNYYATATMVSEGFASQKELLLSLGYATDRMVELREHEMYLYEVLEKADQGVDNEVYGKPLKR